MPDYDWVAPTVGVMAAVGTAITVSYLLIGPKPLPAWPEAAPFPAPTLPSNFIRCAQHLRASYDQIEQSFNTSDVLSAELKFLQRLGIDTVRFDIGYDAFLNNDTATIAKLDAIIAEARTAGLKICIADASAEQYRPKYGGHVEWDQFTADWQQRVQALAARYRPDYYITIKEPGWYFRMIADLRDTIAAQQAGNWMALQQQLYGLVKTANPNAVCGIALAGASLYSSSLGSPLNYGIAQLAVPSPYSDFIGFDVYGYTDILDAIEFIYSNPTSKPIWIPEFWSYNGNSRNAGYDVNALSFCYDYALTAFRSSLQMLSPFFSDYTCSLGMDSITDPDEIIATYANSLEPSFATYRNIFST